jgi:DNA-directed RNA polymerase specialized sigma24 family protein
VTAEKLLAEYLLLIKKKVDSEIRNPEHVHFKEDIVHDVFLKLYNADFFNKYKLGDKEQGLIAASYIGRTAHSCYVDYLQKAGLSRRLTESEREQSGFKFANIGYDDVDDADSGVYLETSSYTAEQYLIARQAYEIIKDCFKGAISGISNMVKATFLSEAFWELAKYDLPLKQLASHLGYENTNPTQEFNRFVVKVSSCTEQKGIKVVNPDEQIEFLKQIIEIDGVTA